METKEMEIGGKGRFKAYMDALGVLDTPLDDLTHFKIEKNHLGGDILDFPPSVALSSQKKFRKKVSDGRKTKKVAKFRAANKRAKKARKKNR